MNLATPRISGRSVVGAHRAARVVLALFLLGGCEGALTGSADAGRDAARAEPDAAGDAGARDAARTAEDGGADGGPAPGDCTGRILCEDFEGYGVGGEPGGPWSTSTSRATVAIDETRAVSGSRAVRIVTEGGDGTYRRGMIFVSGAPLFPLAGHVLWGRMMIYAANLPGVGQHVHWTNVQAEGPIPSMPGVRALYRYGGMNDDRWLANYETSGAASDCWRNSASAMEAGRWVCMEWHFEQASDQMELYVDGERLDDAAIDGRGDGCVSPEWTSDWLGGEWDALRVGWEHYQQTVAHEVWIDDVAMDTARIGCPSP